MKVFDLKKILFFGLLWGMVACDDPSVQRSPSAGLFVDVEALINAQTQALDSLSPEVAKTILVNGRAENRTNADISWEKELAAFKELNISKPGLQNSYDVSSTAPNVRLYTLKPGEHANVQWLKVTFVNGTSRIQGMDGLIKQSNYLYRSEKLLQMTFSPDNQGREQLDAYQIESRKKILFGDEEMLKITGVLQK